MIPLNWDLFDGGSNRLGERPDLSESTQSVAFWSRAHRKSNGEQPRDAWFQRGERVSRTKKNYSGKEKARF